jgi:hypothetical protein
MPAPPNADPRILGRLKLHWQASGTIQPHVLLKAGSWYGLCRITVRVLHPHRWLCIRDAIIAASFDQVRIP